MTATLLVRLLLGKLWCLGNYTMLTKVIVKLFKEMTKLHRVALESVRCFLDDKTVYPCLTLCQQVMS